jgi:hypothetical protein
MEHRDILQIQIDQLGQALSKLFSKMLRIKEEGQTSECLEAADQSLKKELGFNIDDLTALSTDEFYQTESGNEKSKNLYLKCLGIYQHLKNTDSVYPFERQLKIERIKKLTH